MQKLYAGQKPFEKPTPTKLTRAEAEVSEVMLHLREELVALEKRQKSIEQVMDDAQKTCSHRAFFDTAGFDYDIRSCGICGASLGLI
jgi:hypothetical protein